MASNRIPFAHVLRGVAALSVVLFHYLGVFWVWPDVVAGLLNAPPVTSLTLGASRVFGPSPLFSFGGFGVALFFLISGFVIPFSFARQRRLGFVVARACRLWPTYAAGLTVTLVALYAVSSAFGRPWSHSIDVVAWQYALGLRDLAGAPSLDGIVWTLEVEIRFYVLCVILAPALRDGRLGPIVAAAAAVLVVTAGVDLWWSGAPGRSGQWTTVAYAIGLDGQAIGYMLIGTWFNLHLRGRLSTPALIALTPATLACVVLLWSRGPVAVDFSPGVASYMCALLLFVIGYVWRARVPDWRPLTWLADVSYPLYVVHAMPGYALMRLALLAGVRPALAVGVAGACALSGAALLHRWVEVPTQALGRYWARRMASDARH